MWEILVSKVSLRQKWSKIRHNDPLLLVSVIFTFYLSLSSLSSLLYMFDALYCNSHHECGLNDRSLKERVPWLFLFILASVRDGGQGQGVRPARRDSFCTSFGRKLLPFAVLHAGMLPTKAQICQQHYWVF